jgi:hypothetical protein
MEEVSSHMETASSLTLPSERRRDAAVSVRRASIAILAMLGVQFVVGMAVNLYTDLGPNGESVGHALSHAGVVFDIHVVLGVLIVLRALHALARAFATRRRPAVFAAAAGALAVVGAFAAGMIFVGTNHAALSLAMAFLTALAVASYIACLQLPISQMSGSDRSR